MPPAKPTGGAGAIIGWDIGGAHVKACLLRDGRIEEVMQWPAPLWRGLEYLDAVIAAAAVRWQGFAGARHAVTMTAEMTDHFPDRAAGVGALVDRLATRLGPTVRFFAGERVWLDAEQAVADWRRVASANWLATASLIARECSDALLLDVGSTTTDIVPLADGRVRARGDCDADRLAAGELVYVGVVRTPLCALAQRVRFGGREFNVMNELFATTADAFRLGGLLDSRHDQHPAADGGAKDEAGSIRRLARMIGHDGNHAQIREWRSFARLWQELVEERIGVNVQRVLEQGAPPTEAPIVGAGCGQFLAERLARRLQRDYLPFHLLARASRTQAFWTDTCAPSVAIARLFEGGAPTCG